MNISDHRQRSRTAQIQTRASAVWPAVVAEASSASVLQEARVTAAKAAHPSNASRTRTEPHSLSAEFLTSSGHVPADPRVDEDGSLVTEYGLLAVVAATVAGVVIQWASGGALVSLFNALLRHARGLVGA